MNIGEANDTQRLLKVLVGLSGPARPRDPDVWDAMERLADRSNKALGAGMTGGAVRYERPSAQPPEPELRGGLLPATNIVVPAYRVFTKKHGTFEELAPRGRVIVIDGGTVDASWTEEDLFNLGKVGIKVPEPDTDRCHACKAVILAGTEVCGRCNACQKCKDPECAMAH